jgi:2-keto-3-deoxy-L-rhamnonate aldolase RhmA
MRDFRARLRAGEKLLGTMLTLPTPAVAEIVGAAGFDWLFLDAEHGALETRELGAILQAVDHRVPCIVRVAAAAEVPIKKALDLGAAGVIVPQVQSAAQAADVVRFARYSPQGGRGVGLARAHGYGFAFGDYVSTANDRIALIVQVEHVRAVEDIEAIVRVDGIDAVLLGPYDLSASFGKMGRIDDPEVVAAIERVIEHCRAVGMPIGIFGVSAEAVAPYAARGCTLLVAGVDTLMLGSAARELRAALAGAAGTD